MPEIRETQRERQKFVDFEFINSECRGYFFREVARPSLIKDFLHP